VISVAKITIDLKKCVGCGRCKMVCPMQVYELENGKSVAKRPDKCIKCLACVASCPVKAIKVE